LAYAMPAGDNRGMADEKVCQWCGREIPGHAHYVVRIDVFADPAMPSVTQEEVDALDFDRTLNELLEEMKHLSAEDLQDQVHRRFEYFICRACQRRFLANPLGKPRVKGEEAGN
jgi:hypothetical protein